MPRRRSGRWTVRWAPTRSTRRRANGWPARAGSACWPCARPAAAAAAPAAAAGVGVVAVGRRATRTRRSQCGCPRGFFGCNGRARRVRARLRCGHDWPRWAAISRTVLADVRGWRVVEAVDEPSAITTLAPVDGADPQKVRAWLIAERRILTTSAGVRARAAGVDGAGAADFAARGHHRRRSGDVRRGARRRHGRGVSSLAGLVRAEQVGRQLHPALLVALVLRHREYRSPAAPAGCWRE